MTWRHIKGVVESYEDASPSVRRLFVRLPETPQFYFQPGQYLSLRVPVDGETIALPYSIASAPNHSNLVELCFKHASGGPAATYLYACRKGSPLDLSGPFGKFVLQLPVRRDCAFIATGTGITPIRSMLQVLFRTGNKHHITLIFGVRRQRDILYRDEFEAMERKHPNFRFIPTLSRPSPGWRGSRGRVQELVRRHLCGRCDMEAYVCGLNAMVKEVRALLSDCGFSKERIHFERYDN